MLIFQELGVKVTQVPYRGAGPALVDLLGGQMDLGPISAVVARALGQHGQAQVVRDHWEETIHGPAGAEDHGRTGLHQLGY